MFTSELNFPITFIRQTLFQYFFDSWLLWNDLRWYQLSVDYDSVSQLVCYDISLKYATKTKKTPSSESVSELYRLSDRRLSAK
jgi:hypothetical protein